MDRTLGQVLQRAVWERLDLLDELASHADARSLESVARTELPRLTDGWRSLLSSHQPDSRGRCPQCSSPWRPRQGPCAVWRAAHDSLVVARAAGPAPSAPVQPVPVPPPVPLPVAALRPTRS